MVEVLVSTGGGFGLDAHAGSVGLRMVGDRTGLTRELSGPWPGPASSRVHDRGRVLVDVAVMIADRGEAVADIDVLRHQAPVLGSRRSPARGQGPGARSGCCWGASDEGFPSSKVAGTDLGKTVVLDVDATFVIMHSEQELASPTSKRTFGFHPLGVWCDTPESLAALLLTGKAGSNAAADRIEVLTGAIAQVPAARRAKDVLLRCDGVGASHQLLEGSPNKAGSAAAGSSTRWGTRSPRRSAMRSSSSQSRVDTRHRYGWWGP